MTATTTTRRTGQRGKSIEEVVAYALGHRTRVQIIMLLNEGAYTVVEIAETIDEPLNKTSNHVRELLDAGSIEIAESRQRGNVIQHLYRAVQTAIYSKDDVSAWTPQQRQVTAGLMIQSALAEVLAAHWAEKMSNDPDVVLAWDWLNIDAQGRKEVCEEQERSWERLREIEAGSINRVSRTGEETVSYVVAEFGFERARKASKPALAAIDERRTPAD